MTTWKGFDTWGDGPSPQAAVAAGFNFRTWYSSFDASKDGSPGGPATYGRYGIWSVTNFETTVDRVYAGYAAGLADMLHAIGEYAPRGMPKGATIILSADRSIPVGDFPKVLPYYQGAAKAAGADYLPGCYGEQALIAYLKAQGVIKIGWRSMSTAFPGGSSTVGCDIVQTGSATVGGADVDLNYSTVDFFGQWQPGKLYSATPSPAPAPPAPSPTPALRSDSDMQQIESLASHPGEYAYGVGNLGPLGSVTFSCDGYGAPAKLRVVVWNQNGPDVHDNVIVGGSNATAHKTSVRFAVPGDTFLVTVKRLDTGDFPVGVAIP